MQRDGPALYEIPPARARLRRGAGRPAPWPRGCAARARGAAARARRGDLRARARRPRASRTMRSSARCSSDSWSRPPRRAVGSTGTTRRSSAPMRSWSTRSSASARVSRGRAADRLLDGTQIELAPGLIVRPSPPGARAPLARGARVAARSVSAGNSITGSSWSCGSISTGGRAGRARRDRGRGQRAAAGDGGAVAAGPVLFETLDGRPFGIRPVLPIAARSRRVNHATRRLPWRLAGELLVRLACRCRHVPGRGARPLGSLRFLQQEPFRAEQRRGSCRPSSARRGRCAQPFCSRTTRRCAEAVAGTSLVFGAGGRQPTPCRALLETLRHGDRVQLVRELDAELLEPANLPAVVAAC